MDIATFAPFFPYRRAYRFDIGASNILHPAQHRCQGWIGVGKVEGGKGGDSDAMGGR